MTADGCSAVLNTRAQVSDCVRWLNPRTILLRSTNEAVRIDSELIQYRRRNVFDVRILRLSGLMRRAGCIGHDLIFLTPLRCAVLFDGDYVDVVVRAPFEYAEITRKTDRSRGVS